MKLTRKHFVLFVEVMKKVRRQFGGGDLSPRAYVVIVEEMASALAEISGTFDPERFKLACLPGKKGGLRSWKRPLPETGPATQELPRLKEVVVDEVKEWTAKDEEELKKYREQRAARNEEMYLPGVQPVKDCPPPQAPSPPRSPQSSG